MIHTTHILRNECSIYDSVFKKLSLGLDVYYNYVHLIHKMAFVPIQEPNSCVVNAIAYLKGENSVPEDWMIDYNNLHQEGKKKITV